MATLDAAAASPTRRLDFGAGLWRLADPKITLASAAGIFLAVCAAAAAGPLAWGWLAVVVAGVFAVEVAKNASGEIFDWDSGVDQRVALHDRTPFSGGKRVLVDGLLTRGQTAAIAASGGGGEAAVGLCYGPLLVAGTYLALRRELPPAVVAVALPLGVLVAAFLWINELPDVAADAAAGKRTLVVALGRRRAAHGLAGLFVVAFGLLLLLPLLGLPWLVLGGLAGAPAAWRATAVTFAAATDTPRLVPAQVATLLAFLLYAAGAGAGLWLSGGA